jgi:AraC-like DNA-binding protein
MFVYSYNYVDLHKLINDLAGKLKGTIKDNTFIYPEWLATGYSKIVEVAPGVQAWISDYTLNDDLLLIRRADKNNNYILRIYEATVKELKVQLNDATGPIEQKNLSNYAVLYTDLNEVSALVNKGTKIRGVEIIFSPQWIINYLHLDNENSLLQKFLMVQQNQLLHIPLNFEFTSLLDKLFEPGNEFLEQRIMANRIELLIEKYFVYLNKIFNDYPGRVKISQQEFETLNKIKSILTREDAETPPTIPELSKMAGMSASSLKSKFKRLFQSGIYEYYQRHRLHKAMDMLSTGKYSVKEVGMELGFINLSNFSIAFKNEFGMLPSEVLKRRNNSRNGQHA